MPNEIVAKLFLLYHFNGNETNISNSLATTFTMFSQKINGFLFGSNGKWNLILTLFPNTKYTYIQIYVSLHDFVCFCRWGNVLHENWRFCVILPRIQRQSATKLHETNFQRNDYIRCIMFAGIVLPFFNLFTYWARTKYIWQIFTSLFTLHPSHFIMIFKLRQMRCGKIAYKSMPTCGGQLKSTVL